MTYNIYTEKILTLAGKSRDRRVKSMLRGPRRYFIKERDPISRRRASRREVSRQS